MQCAGTIADCARSADLEHAAAHSGVAAVSINGSQRQYSVSGFDQAAAQRVLADCSIDCDGVTTRSSVYFDGAICAFDCPWDSAAPSKSSRSGDKSIIKSKISIQVNCRNARRPPTS